MSTILRVKSTAMMVSERQPWRAGAALKGGRAGAGRIGPEGGQVEDGQVRHESGKLLVPRPDQKVADEERVPGVFGEDPGLDPISRIRAAIEILREEILFLGRLEEIRQDGVELLARQRRVVVPPHLGLGLGGADHELVARRTAGVHARVGSKRPALKKPRLLAP